MSKARLAQWKFNCEKMIMTANSIFNSVKIRGYEIVTPQQEAKARERLQQCNRILMKLEMKNHAV